MKMGWKEEYMDVILVPIGLLIMMVYHIHLFHKSKCNPKSTVIGYENYCRTAWVDNMLKMETKDRGQCKDVISTTISTTTFLASMSLVLGSLMGTWVASNSENNIFKLKMIYGNTSSSIISVKYICILAFFLLAFAAFLQSARHYVHANFLITMAIDPIKDDHIHNNDNHGHELLPENVLENERKKKMDLQREVLRACTFWTLGLRSIYFAITLLMWIFGPITFFCSAVIMVLILYILDARTPEDFPDYNKRIECKESSNVFKRIVATAEDFMHFHHHDSEGSNERRNNQNANGQAQVASTERVQATEMQNAAAAIISSS